MAYIDLINELTSEDKKRIENYIYTFGCSEDRFIGIDNWLSNWSHSNQILYRLLGNKLIHKVEFTYEKDKSALKREFVELIHYSHFKKSYHDFYVLIIKSLEEDNQLNKEQLDFFNHLLNYDNFINDKISHGIKYKAPNAKKMLQIQAGAKPLKAINRVINYFKDIYTFEGFEEFRVKHSLIMNDKILKGQLCISIHPLDFMTMSDNNSNWQSCMSWKNDGCYRVGTIEMMNSNNVLCCYLEAESPFVFNDKMKDTLGSWNNKKWRQLIYVNKNIIMSGKAYPYSQKNVTFELLNRIKDLAKENLNWNYKYGIEPYKDMLHITSAYRMENQRTWMKSKSSIKKNILWDTKGMYNDMLNDNTYEYYCYRNKVNNTKIYSVSGKCPCLMCGESIISKEYSDDDYNERYDNVGSTICNNCWDSIPECISCGQRSITNTEDTMEIKISNNNSKIETFFVCSDCYNTYAKTCPCCGKPIWVEPITIGEEDKKIKYYFSPRLYEYEKINYKESEHYISIVDPRFRNLKTANQKLLSMPKDFKELQTDIIYIERLYICNDCTNKNYNYKEITYKKDAHFWTKKRDNIKTYRIIDPEIGENMRLYSSKKVENKDAIFEI